MSMLDNPTFQKYNPFRRPNWRWERVLELCNRRSARGRCSVRDDLFIRKARKFHKKWTDCTAEAQREKLWYKHPALYYAHYVHERANDDPEFAMFLEARLLANQTYEQIASAMETLPQVVRWYEALFFDVGSHLKARDWITKHVLLPAMMKHHAASQTDPGSLGQALPFRDSQVARPFLDGSLKLFAYFGGPFMVDFLIAGFEAGKPLTSSDGLAEWFDSNWSATVRRRSTQAAHQFEINKYNVMELFNTHSRIIEIESSDESQDKKRTMTEKHIKALMDELPWCFGDEGTEIHRGTPLGHFDDSALELRDVEVLQVCGGQELLDIKEWPDELPPAKPKTSALLENKDIEL